MGGFVYSLEHNPPRNPSGWNWGSHHVSKSQSLEANQAESGDLTGLPFSVLEQRLAVPQTEAGICYSQHLLFGRVALADSEGVDKTRSTRLSLNPERRKDVSAAAGDPHAADLLAAAQ